MSKKTKVLTGITTSGIPHIGNLAGAILPAIETTKDNSHESFLFLADYHSLIKTKDPDITHSSSTVKVIDYINIKSEQLTTYFDLLSTEKNGINGEGLRAQYTYKPDKLSRNSGSILYFDKEFRLNDFGYLQRNDWFHLGVGHNIQKIDFAKDSNVILKELSSYSGYI